MERDDREPAAGSLVAEAAARVQEIVVAAERQADERVAATVGRLLRRIDELSASLDELRAEIASLARADAAQPEPPAPDAARSTDEAGARLVALNMALEGSPRDATARYLDEQFELPDLDALLDDVYASAGR